MQCMEMWGGSLLTSQGVEFGGILEAAQHQHFDVDSEPGDCLLSYADAPIECCDADGEKCRVKTVCCASCA